MIITRNLVKTYISGEIETPVLKGIDLEIKSGEYIAITGRSGAGKSTLLYQLGLLDMPTSGTLLIDTVDVLKLNQNARTQFRLERLGYVFQDYALLPELTALENIIVPLLMLGVAKKDAYDNARDALKQVGLDDKMYNLPSQLSGGQQQRVSIARAIAHKPKILFADEPTANLDSRTGATVMKVFRELHTAGQTIVMVTHEQDYTKEAQRIIRLEDGVVV